MGVRLRAVKLPQSIDFLLDSLEWIPLGVIRLNVADLNSFSAYLHGFSSRGIIDRHQIALCEELPNEQSNSMHLMTEAVVALRKR